jgi:hypothetical protein
MRASVDDSVHVEIEIVKFWNLKKEELIRMPPPISQKYETLA